MGSKEGDVSSGGGMGDFGGSVFFWASLQKEEIKISIVIQYGE